MAYWDYDANVDSINPIVEIERSSPVPLHEQVPAAFRGAMAEGKAAGGPRSLR